MAGQGTAAKELIEDAGRARRAGGLPGRRGATLRVRGRRARVEPRQSSSSAWSPKPATTASTASARGEIVHIDTPQTIADGAQTQHLGEHTFPVIRRLVERHRHRQRRRTGFEAMKFFAARMKMIVEPTGCLAAAAVFERKLDVQGQESRGADLGRQRRPGALRRAGEVSVKQSTTGHGIPGNTRIPDLPSFAIGAY